MELRRDLGPIAATSVVVGSMIGSGIFFGPQIVAWEFAKRGIEPTTGLVIGVWVAAGFLVLLGALTFAELAAAMPESGGQYAYLREAYGKGLAFLQGWSSFFIGKAASVSALAVAFGALLSELEGGTYITGGLDTQFVGVALIVLLTGVNYVGVRFGGWVQTVTTILKVGALVLLGVAAFVLTTSAPLPEPATVSGSGSLIAAFGLALVPALWAYDGWYNSTQVAEEVDEPERNLPLSLIGGVIAVMAVYALANLAYIHVLGGDGLAGIAQRLGENVAAAESPAGLTARLVGGSAFGDVIIAGVLISIFGTCNAVILTGPRIIFAMARDGVFFRPLVRVHEDFQTPHTSILLLGVWSIMLVFFLQTFEALITLVIFATWLWVGLAGLAVITMRRTHPEMPRPYKVPGYPWVPLAFVLLAGIFTLNLILEDFWGSLLGAIIILAGLPVYVYLAYQNEMGRIELEEID